MLLSWPVFRSLAEEGKAMLEKEKTMLELELKQMQQKHSVDLDKKEHTISSVSLITSLIQGMIMCYGIQVSLSVTQYHL